MRSRKFFASGYIYRSMILQLPQMLKPTSLISHFCSFWKPLYKSFLQVGYHDSTIGNMENCLEPFDNPVNMGGLSIGLGWALIIILVLLIIFILLKFLKPPPPNEAQYSAEPTLLESLSPDLRAEVDKVLIDPSRIQLKEQIGSGYFGQVYRGLLDGIKDVAIKTIKWSPIIALPDKVSFLKEAAMMIDFNHRNVLSLIAIYIKDDFPYVVLPLMENGDLQTFVSKPDMHFSVLELTSICLQVAEGMEYLAEKKLVHRDLAARNCMIDNDLVVKVSDFGLARDIFEKDYYRPRDANQPLPCKWMPIECLCGQPKFTDSSDVWSFGVLMWELFSRGKAPYEGINNRYLEGFLQRGGRLEKPEHMPDSIYDLMQDCWKKTPTERPRFKEIVRRLRTILSHMRLG